MKERIVLILSFFFLTWGVSSQAEANSPEPFYSNPVWNALFQRHPGSKDISDAKFYLSPERTLAAEWTALAQALNSEHRDEVICKFPARVLWMATQLSLTNISFAHCTELNKFLALAPAEDVSVVFAAENISQPSSMMGHVFLKLHGQSAKGIPVDHMISFFTEIQNANIPQLIWESLIVGKKSYYTLSPYEDNKNYYLFAEQRNIWEYQLRLDVFQKKLLQYYLYEIKDVSFLYFFHSFNCATLTRNILAVIWPEQVEKSFWVTPLDVVRKIDDPKYVSNRFMLPSTKWRVKSLETQLQPPRKELRKINERDFANLDFSSRGAGEKWLTLELANAVNDHQFESGKTDIGGWRQGRAFLSQEKEKTLPGHAIDLRELSNPSQTQGDSQVFGSWVSYRENSRYILGFLPAAHGLFNDDRQYLNQWELKMGEVALASADGEVDLERLILYSAISFAPSDLLIPTYSGLLRAGIESRTEEDLSLKKSFFAEGGLGKTFRLHPAIDFHFLMNGGYQSEVRGHLFAGPQLGMRILEKKGLSSQFLLTHYFYQTGAAISKGTFSQIYNTKDFSIEMEFSRMENFAELLSENFYRLNVSVFF